MSAAARLVFQAAAGTAGGDPKNLASWRRNPKLYLTVGRNPPADSEVAVHASPRPDELATVPPPATPKVPAVSDAVTGSLATVFFEFAQFDQRLKYGMDVENHMLPIAIHVCKPGADVPSLACLRCMHAVVSLCACMD